MCRGGVIFGSLRQCLPSIAFVFAKIYLLKGFISTAFREKTRILKWYTSTCVV